MHHLVYLSTASYPFSEKDLQDILHQSRNNNAAADITGMLLYHETSIIQVLEGEKLKIYALYLKIMKDRRHNSIVKLIDEDIVKRDFTDWSMGFKRLTNDQLWQLKGYVNLQDKKLLLHETQSKSIEIFTMIQTFITVNMR